MKRNFLILISAIGILFSSCGQNIKDEKKEQNEQITQELKALGMIKLYKNIDNKLHYWETWDKDTKTGIVHWGEVGTKGQDKEIKSGLINNYATKIRKEIDQKTKEGYAEFDEEKYAFLEIEYIIDGFGTEQDLDKRHRLEGKMNEILGWTGLGHNDGGSIGSGTMEVGCMVVDFEIAKKIVEENLKDTEFENYSRIFNMGAE
jgi:predicted DNA-binding WGR domain protein